MPSRRVSMLIQLTAMPFPWRLRRAVLRRLLGFEIADTAHIGYSIVETRRLTLEEHARIHSLTLVKGLSRVHVARHGVIGSLNWITGFPLENRSYFTHVAARDPSLSIGVRSGITNWHMVDCTDSVSIGDFSMVSGWHSQIMSHSIDVAGTGEQTCKPIRIGNHCFLGTRSIVLPGTDLGDYTVVEAGSVVSGSVRDP